MSKQQEILDALHQSFEEFFKKYEDGIDTVIAISSDDPVSAKRAIKQLTQNAFTEGALKALTGLKDKI